MEKTIFITKDNDSMRIIKRKDGTTLITAISGVNGNKKNWIRPKGFSIEEFIKETKRFGWVIDGQKKETPIF